METFCYYICCFGCCGLCCSKKFVKKMTTKSDKKTIKRLRLMTPPDDRRVAVQPSDPLKTKTLEMTEIHTIPNEDFKTVTDVLNHFKYRIIGQPIGEGGMGKVYKAVDMSSGETIACKTIGIPKSKNNPLEWRRSRVKGIKKELFTHWKISKHRFIVKLFKHFIITDQNETTLYIFMQFAPKSLSKHLTEFGPYDESTCKIFFAQILSAVSYMHSNHIAHRDLKASNILLDENDDVLVADFGTSSLVFSEKENKLLDSTTYCGTEVCMAPELLERKLTYNGFAVDIWALGILLYNLFNKDYPFKLKAKATAIRRMKKKKWSFSNNIKEEPTPLLIDILKRMLEPDPALRATVEELCEHQWIKDVYQIYDQKAKEWMKSFTQTEQKWK